MLSPYEVKITLFNKNIVQCTSCKLYINLMNLLLKKSKLVFFLLQMFLFRERITLLVRHSANQNEYLIVKHRDGRIEHKEG